MLCDFILYMVMTMNLRMLYYKELEFSITDM